MTIAGWLLPEVDQEMATTRPVLERGIRGCFRHHVVHHRALRVCLRLNDIPVPSLYGPSADEGI